MEKTFEEKFGLKIEEMEEILGGTGDGSGSVSPIADPSDPPVSCVACSASCMTCTNCSVCQSRFADIVPLS
ncbi:MAG: hypothetical protein FWD60_10930 [Candidatus Azobacteroides sp.]|nr:hypothetical protein [Candidatus Azobacteroides sp.]